ncbi:hypothetical protein BHE74_00029999 [Ensete ventricosum]|nr:hypothetical protein BHE74_00029999 [Ensete ventricosum]RZS00055.1 hypothetical protein BHM03_00029698 [Ensete ventricosum]
MPPQETMLLVSPSNAAPTLIDVGHYCPSVVATLIIIPFSPASSAASSIAPPQLHHSCTINVALVSSSPPTVTTAIACCPSFFVLLSFPCLQIHRYCPRFLFCPTLSMRLNPAYRLASLHRCHLSTTSIVACTTLPTSPSNGHCSLLPLPAMSSLVVDTVAYSHATTD